MSRATDEALDAVHALVAELLASELRAAKVEAAKEGDSRKAVNPQLLDKAMKFLKDNGVDAPAKSARMSNLLGELQDLDLDQEGSRLTN